MKRLDKRTLIIASTFIVLATTGAVFAVNKQNSQKASVLDPLPIAQTDTSVTPQTQTTVAPVTPTDTTQTAVADTTTTTTTTTAPTAPAPVRTFEEIIQDYPKMSSTPQIADCSRQIAAKFPNRFLDSNREFNIALLNNSWASMCYLVNPEPWGNPSLLTEDWWTKNGAH